MIQAQSTVSRDHEKIFIRHAGKGQAEAAKPLVESLMRYCDEFRAENKKALIFHDTQNLASSSEGYARQFGEAGIVLGNEHFDYVMYIPSALVRIVAMFAISLSGLTVHVCKSVDKTKAKVASLGYDADSLFS